MKKNSWEVSVLLQEGKLSCEAYIAPLVAPSFVTIIDAIMAEIVVVLSLAMYLLSSNQIKREKLLP